MTCCLHCSFERCSRAISGHKHKVSANFPLLGSSFFLTGLHTFQKIFICLASLFGTQSNGLMIMFFFLSRTSLQLCFATRSSKLSWTPGIRNSSNLSQRTLPTLPARISKSDRVLSKSPWRNFFCRLLN